MSDTALQEKPVADDAPPLNEVGASSEADAFADLRRLLLQPEQDKLTRLDERFGDPEQRAEEISEVLPEAILLRSGRDKRLAKALQPTFEEALRASIKKDPRPFVDAVTPVMGTAIRKAIAEALGAMMQSLNRTLDNSVSVRSLQWRLEAARTGKPFAEIVLLHTLEYRVEQVFLIHRETGLLLQHAVAGDDDQEGIQDADMVSGMLTAIQDFVRDSFNAENSETLEAMKVGGLTVWIEQGSQATLAGVIRGAAPQELRAIFQDALDSIHLEFHDALNDFQGDATAFEPCRPYLEACLQAKYQKPVGQQSSISPPIAIGASVLLLTLGLLGFFYIRSYLRWNNYLTRLQNEPGIVVVNASHGLFSCHIEGLRDPLAADPVALLPEAKLDPTAVSSRWDEYQALHPRLIEQRARRLLEPPDTVRLSVKDGALYAQGAASPEWVAEARKLARGLAGVREFAYAGDTAADIKTVESSFIRFAMGSAELTPEAAADVARLAALLRQINAGAPNGCQAELTGRADPLGSSQMNQSLSQNRAETVRAALLAAGLKAEQITAQGVGMGEVAPAEKARENAASRSVSFRVLCPQP